MPKIVNHEKRKIQIAEATWKVIVEEGLEHASVRNIAKASGISAGSLRHYFTSQSDLLQYSMKLVSDRVQQRAGSKDYNGEALEMLTDLICEILPVDDERRVETEVWFIFSAKSLADASLQSLSHQVYGEMRGMFLHIVNTMQAVGLAGEGIDAELEAIRLHALVDGMATHHLLHPGIFTYRHMLDTLIHHLKSLGR